MCRLLRRSLHRTYLEAAIEQNPQLRVHIDEFLQKQKTQYEAKNKAVEEKVLRKSSLTGMNGKRKSLLGAGAALAEGLKDSFNATRKNSKDSDSKGRFAARARSMPTYPAEEEPRLKDEALEQRAKEDSVLFAAPSGANLDGRSLDARLNKIAPESGGTTLEA